MVFDWFKRNQPPQPPEEPAAAEVAQGDTPEPGIADTEVGTPPTAAVASTPQGAGEQLPEADPQLSAPHPEDRADPSTGGGDSEDALEWARQAYARLKAQQQAAAQAAVPVASDSSPQPAAAESTDQAALEQEPADQETVELATPLPAAGASLLEQAAARRAERQQSLTEPAPTPTPAVSSPATPEPVEPEEPQLGAFDDSFTWSAEVLAAQGKRADQVSMEEIDWLGRLRQGLEKTRRGFVTQLLDTLGDDPLTPEVLDDLESALLRADVGVTATDRVLEALRQRLNEEVVDPAEGIRFLKEQLRAILDTPNKGTASAVLAPQRDRLNIWLMVGVNGVGKTTTLGKIANLATRSGYSCLIAAADTFRAAAVEQVQVWGQRSQVPVIANPSANADPAAVVYDALGAARASGIELVLVDTAGRLQTKHNLMEELTKVRRIIDKLAPEAVVESLLVLDASQGQNGLKQAMAFARAAALTGVVITKLDGSARGGVALAVASEADLPIRFIGAGEGIRDLRPFNSFEFVEALLAS